MYAQQGSIEGVAVNGAGGQPLAGVHVRLMSGRFEGIKEVYGAISDKNGHFSIAAMQPGSYILAPECPGFVYMPPRTVSLPVPAIQIRAGQKVEGYKLEMTPRAVLAGRVVDDFGDPVAHVPVVAMPVSPETATINLLFGGQYSQTDDRGEFRIVTGPGKFHIKATPYSSSDESPEIRTDGTSDVVYGPTFYPNAASVERATAIEATAGNEVNGLEIRLIAQRSLTISGVVTGIPDGSMRATVMMRFGESAQQLNNSRGFGAGPDGKFSFSRLTPGFYRLSASYTSGAVRMQSGTVDVKLDSADETGVELALNGGAELTGTLEVTGLPAAKRSMRLDSAQGPMYMMMPLSGDVDGDGVFKIANVPPGKYKVAVEPLPDDGYVKTVLLDGAAAAGGVLDLSHGARGSRVKVVASAGAGQISGKVLDKDGQPIANSVSVVFLMADPTATSEEAITRVSADGSYSKKGIRPGKYRLFALDIFHYVGGQGAQSNDFTEAFSRGEEIEIKEGDKIVKDIKVLEKEDANGKNQ
jgi:hypothetical protein